MFLLAHLSDVHLGPLPETTYRDLVSKRITGYINWQRNRSAALQDGVTDAIIADLKAHHPNHIAVTGDLVNLALDAEIEQSRCWLEALGTPADVSVVPGNHDAYVAGALAKACKAWSGFMQDDRRDEPTRPGGFPYLRMRGPVALIGLSSARATAPFMASGFFGQRQANRLSRLLDETREMGLFRVVMIHHPPVQGATAAHKRLFGIRLFQKTIANHGAELVLHGHTHLPTTYRIAGHDGPVPVIGVAAAGQAPNGKRPPAQFNLFEIEGEPGAWRLKLRRRGISSINPQVHDISVEQLTD